MSRKGQKLYDAVLAMPPLATRPPPKDLTGMSLGELKATAKAGMPAARALWIREIWKRTPKDYRSTREGKKHVMAMGPHGTTVVCLNDMSDEKLFELWAKG